MNPSSVIEDFSVLNTKLDFYHHQDRVFIKKTVTPNVDLGISMSALKTWFDQYLLQLKCAAIPLPIIRQVDILEESLVFHCLYRGQNIVEAFPSIEALLAEPSVLHQIIEIINRAVKSNVYLDPHAKNFVLENNQISYVDFSPPYIEKYIDHRLKLAKDKLEWEIMSRNFGYFSPGELIYHFVGDFFNVFGVDAEDSIKKLVEFLVAHQYTEDSAYKFMQHAKAIRLLEDLRLEKEIFLF